MHEPAEPEPETAPQGVSEGVPVTALQWQELHHELAEQRRRLELVKKAAHTVIYVLDLDTLEVEWVNRTIGDALGYKDADLDRVDRDFFTAHLHPEDLVVLPANLERWRTAPDDVVIESEYRLRHRLGSWRTFLARNMVHTRGDDQRPTHIIGTLVDVTVRRELQRMAARGAKVEAVARTAGSIALDFNNLLTVVLGSVALARTAIAQGADPTPHLDELSRVAEQAAGISRRLMGFAREQAVAPELVDVATFLREHERLLLRLVAATHPNGTSPQLSLEIGETWPIRIDPTQLTQMLVALITRADERGSKVVLKTSCLDSPRRSVITVLDEGDGPLEVPTELRGVDLSLIDNMVRQHHGELEVMVSTPNTGGESALVQSHVALTFPATQEATPIQETRPLPPKPDTGALVIVAEDEPMVAELTRRILVHAGHRVKLCKDGLDALEAIRAHHDEVALLISDIVMPRLSGLELVAVLAHELPDLPILLASGYPEDERRLNDPTLADVAFLPKPFRAADLLASVSQLLARHAAGRRSGTRLEA